jgi:diguanylate cyclase (GGDEF)-like protein/PAS domain S-box-containing protein
VGTLGELFRWLGIAVAALRARIVRRYRAVLARLFKRDVVVARSERKFRALLEAAPDAIVIFDWHGHIQLVNAQAERTFGYRRDDLLGENLSRLIPERDRAAHRAGVRHYLRDATARPMGDMERFCLRKDGTEFPAEISRGPLETDQGLLVLSVIRDVTDRKCAEAALRDAQTEAEAEERFRTAFEEAPVGIILAGIDGGLLKVNQALCEITGFTREELEATTLPMLLDPEDRERDAAEMAGVLSGDTRRYRAEQRYRTAGGETVPVDVSVALTRDRDGAPLHLLAQVNDITDRKRIEGQLQYLADHDPLTGLLNRRCFEKELALMIDQGPAGAVLAVDLDHFKFVNDTLGHSVGDDLIVRVASLLQAHLRSTDVLARLGGDEFAVLLHGAGAEQASLVAAILLEALSAEAGRADEASAMRWVTASIGVAWVGENRSGAAGILIEADIAMYDAKAAGRNRIALYDATGNRQSQAQEGLSWAQKIRHALEHDRFVLHAQPILSLTGDPIPHHELLIRMQGDDDELISPGEFLGIAERVDLVQPIDRWVFHNAIEILAREKRAGRDIRLAVNLSARSMIDPEMTPFVAQELANAGIDGRGLCIELTETAAVANVARAQRFAHELRELGCEFALDDFGSGFASFYYLKQIHFDLLKIDGEFIRDLPDNKINQLVVQSVVSIARGLGRRTVAEFVGDAQTLQLLRAYDVDFAQGFYVGRPQSLDLLDLAAIPFAADVRDVDAAATR